MDLNTYFEGNEGIGILSTAGPGGYVDSAVYAAPHIMDESTIAFIMRPRRSYANIQNNPKAVYMFIEKGSGYKGKRVYLEKTSEETDPEKINLLRRSHHGSHGDEEQATLVYFKVTGVRPLVGDTEQT